MPEVRARTLRRAAEIVGGEEALAGRLGITPSHLVLWLQGVADVPDSVFLRAVDIVLAALPSLEYRNETAQSRTRNSCESSEDAQEITNTTAPNPASSQP